MFKNRIQCPLKCNSETPLNDTQEHLLECLKLKSNYTSGVSIKNAYEDIQKQEAVAKVVAKVLRHRKRLLNELDETNMQERTDLS